MGYTKKHKAAAKVADCKPSELELLDWDHYGLELYGMGGYSGQQYAVGLDAEVDDAVAQYVKDTVWAFKAEFLASHTDLPEIVFTALQEKLYDNANDPILKLIEAHGDIDDFVAEAVQYDGRGHFLSGYDGEEHEVEIGSRGLFTTLYVFRQ